MIQGVNQQLQEFFSSVKCPDQLWGQPSLIFSEYEGSILVLKWPVCGAVYLPPSSAQVKNKGSYISPPPLCLHGMGRGNFLCA